MEPEDKKIYLDVKALTVLKVGALVVLLLLAMRFVNSISSILLIVATALLFAVALNPGVKNIRRLFNFKNRTTATGLAFSILVVVIAVFFISTTQLIFNRISDFATDLPATIETFLEEDNFISEALVSYGLDGDLQSVADEIANLFPDNVDSWISLVRSTSSALGNIIVTSLLILVFTFLILVEAPALIDKLKQSLPEQQAERWTRLGREMNKVIIGYTNGQLLVALIGGIFAFLIMTILQIEDALALAAIVSCLSLVPLIGALIGSVLAVFLTLIVDVNSAIILAVYFIIYQQVENLTIQPWLQSKQTNLSTFQILLAVLIGGTVAGVIGVLLSIPIAACLKIVLIDYFNTNREKFNKDYKRLFRKKKKVADS